jgi:NDP-sugar pyrophosphorylase family protein
VSGAGPALLLAAGRATRLGAVGERWAKACVPVGATTALDFLLPRVAAAGYAPIWINLHRHAAQVRATALAAAPGAELRFFEEERLLGTGGTLLAVARAAGAAPRRVAKEKI